MIAWSIPKWGLDNLRLQEVPDPKPGPGQVVVKFAAASLNYRDLLVVNGLYNPKFPLPLIPGSDASGKIVELGPAVAKSNLNQNVLTTFAPKWHTGPPKKELVRPTLGGPLAGVFSEYRVFDLEDLLFPPCPSWLTPTELASLPCAGVTAWNALVDYAQLKPGQVVVILGTGGVSIFGIQIAAMLGAKPLVLSSSPSKRARAIALGAKAAADYNEIPEWSKWVLEETAGKGADVVLETGGSGTLEQSLKAVKVGGCVPLIGTVSGTKGGLNILPIVMKSIRVQGVTVGNKDQLQSLISAFGEVKERPIIGEVFKLEELPLALERLAEAKHFGKIAIDFHSR